jgi:HEAT repeat protein
MRLGRSTTWRRRQALERIARLHYSPEARAAAAYALGFGFNPRSCRTLAALLADTAEDAQVRAHAAEALGHIRAVEAPSNPEVANAVLAGLDADNAEVRFFSIFAAAILGIAEATSRLQELTDDHETVLWPIATEARWALRRLAGDPEADDELPTFG